METFENNVSEQWKAADCVNRYVPDLKYATCYDLITSVEQIETEDN
jgi:hypothetical protein